MFVFWRNLYRLFKSSKTKVMRNQYESSPKFDSKTLCLNEELLGDNLNSLSLANDEMTAACKDEINPYRVIWLFLLVYKIFSSKI